MFKVLSKLILFAALCSGGQVMAQAFAIKGTESSSLMPGQVVTLTATVKPTAAQSNLIIDMEVHDSSNNKVGQNTLTGQTFTVNQQKTYTWNYTIPSNTLSGVYTLHLGVFSANYASLLFWQGNIVTYAVAGATAPPPPPPPAFALGQVPFSASSPWNTPVPTTAQYTVVNLSSGYPWVAWDSYGDAVYFSLPSDPLVAVQTPGSWGYPAGVIQVHVPAGVTGANGTDGSVIIIDGTTVYNFWQFNRTSNTTATVAANGQSDVLTGTGWGTASPFLGAGITAAGSSQLGGLIVQAETDKGEIQHALSLALDGALLLPNPVAPAIASDGGSATGVVHEGGKLAIPRSVAMPTGLSPLGQKVFRAMQNYGCFAIDTAPGTLAIAMQSNAYDQATLNALRVDMSALAPLLQLVH